MGESSGMHEYGAILTDLTGQDDNIIYYLNPANVSLRSF